MFSHYIHHVWASGWFTFEDIGLLLCLDTPVCSLSYQWCHLCSCTSEYNVLGDILKVNISFSTKVSILCARCFLTLLCLSWWISLWLVFIFFNWSILVSNNAVCRKETHKLWRYLIISIIFHVMNVKEISRRNVVLLQAHLDMLQSQVWYQMNICVIEIGSSNIHSGSL